MSFAPRPSDSHKEKEEEKVEVRICIEYASEERAGGLFFLPPVSGIEDTLECLFVDKKDRARGRERETHKCMILVEKV